MVFCDLCERAKECSERRIEDKKYDICADCWNALAAKLKDKGRNAKDRPIVLLPASQPAAEPETRPEPHRLPEIWGKSVMSQNPSTC